MAQFDYFLKIDGIDGESADAKHKGEIEILSFSWGATNPSARGAGGGGGAGKVSLQDLHFTSTISKASPALFLNAANGQHIKNAVLTVRKGNAKGGTEFLKVTLEDVLVSSFQEGGSNGEAPTEEVTLNFSKITVSYQTQKPDGSLDAPVSGSWDVGANKPM